LAANCETANWLTGALAKPAYCPAKTAVDALLSAVRMLLVVGYPEGEIRCGMQQSLCYSSRRYLAGLVWMFMDLLNPYLHQVF
jgi:hypothetical protein